MNLKPEQTNIFFRLMEERYGSKAIITTNLEFEEWHNFLSNDHLVKALLSRLCHRCHILRINGPISADRPDLNVSQPASKGARTQPGVERFCISDTWPRCLNVDHHRHAGRMSFLAPDTALSVVNFERAPLALFRRALKDPGEGHQGHSRQQAAAARKAMTFIFGFPSFTKAARETLKHSDGQTLDGRFHPEV